MIVKKQNFEQLSFKKYAVTLHPSENTPVPRLLYLKYYRAECYGWNSSSQCFTCTLEYRDTIHPFTNCRQPADCYCNISKRQHPSLLTSVGHIVFNLVFNLERFETTKNVTYKQYLYAVNSNQLSNWKNNSNRISCPTRPFLFLLSPSQIPPQLFGRRSWNGSITNEHHSISDVVSDLVNPQ